MSSTRPLELDHHLAERDKFRGNVAEAMYPKQPQSIAGKHQFQHALRLRRLLACQKAYAPAYHFRGLIYNSTHTPRKERVFPSVT